MFVAYGSRLCGVAKEVSVIWILEYTFIPMDHNAKMDIKLMMKMEFTHDLPSRGSSEPTPPADRRNPAALQHVFIHT